MKTSLELNNIKFAYGENPVLRDFSLSVEAGEMTALLGASGCGKSTVLRIIAGMLRPDEGTVLFEKEDYTTVAAEKREAVMMFQKPLLFPYLNVADNVAFGLKMRKVPKSVISEKLVEILDMVQLSGFEHRMPKQLSGGQEQRVALARALVTQPRILLLDEPLSALDANLRAEMRFLLRDLQQRLGITTIFVTHDQSEAVKIADRIAFMNFGKNEQNGIPHEFFTAPNTPKVAEFFGWKVYKGTRRGSSIETEIGSFDLSGDNAARLVSDTVHIAFHPDNIAICAEKYALSHVIKCELLERMDLGTRQNFLFRFRDGSVVQLEIVEHATGNSENGFMNIYIPLDSLLFFDD